MPLGPTAHFKLSNVKITKDIRRDWREITDHRPEVILNNFTTRLGHSVARMLAVLFLNASKLQNGHYKNENRSPL